jgi:hypothetical protein
MLEWILFNINLANQFSFSHIFSVNESEEIFINNQIFLVQDQFYYKKKWDNVQIRHFKFLNKHDSFNFG